MKISSSTGVIYIAQLQAIDFAFKVTRRTHETQTSHHRIHPALITTACYGKNANLPSLEAVLLITSPPSITPTQVTTTYRTARNSSRYLLRGSMNNTERKTMQTKKFFYPLIFLLLLAACTTPEPPVSEVVIVTPTDTYPPPPTPTSPPNPTPTIISQTPTPLPEGAIAWGALYEDISPEALEMYESWARTLSQATGLNIILVPALMTEMETLEALRDGRIHMATMAPLAYVVGHDQGWVEPGPISIWGEQEAESIMFISRTDTGFLPGEPPEVFQQLEGSRACWPETKNIAFSRDIRMWEFDFPSYILPLGLLRLNGVENVLPVMLEGPSYEGYYPNLKLSVFHKQCEFAAIKAISPEDFKDWVPGPDINRGEWERKMQILYTTGPINPSYRLYGFSSTLQEAVREQLTQAILANPGPYETSEYFPINETYLDEFQRIALASGLDLQSYLTAPDS